MQSEDPHALVCTCLIHHEMIKSPLKSANLLPD
jgi:hypothetical protein